MRRRSGKRITDTVVELAGDGDHRGLARTLATEVASSRTVCSEVVGRLIGRCASVIRARSDQARQGEVFTVFMHGSTADPALIDDLPPGIRAAVRALLADLNDEPGDRAVQVDLAVDGGPCESVRVVVQCLAWVRDLDDPAAGMPELYCVTG